MRFRRWTKSDSVSLKENYNLMPTWGIAKKLGFSVNTIRHKASVLGLRKRKLWTSSDSDFLKENYEKINNKRIAKLLGFSASTIINKASGLGLKKNGWWRGDEKIRSWSDEEVKFVEENYSNTPTSEIAERLNRTPSAVEATASKIGIKKDKWWTKEDEDFVRRNYGKVSEDELANQLSRSLSSIAHKTSRLGLPEQKRGGSSYFYNPIPKTFALELAYIVGVLLGDGSLTETDRSNGRVEQYLWLASIDREFTEFFRRCLLNIVKSGRKEMKVFKRGYESPRKDEWCVSPYVNREWYKFLKWATTNRKEFVSKLDDESLVWWIKGFFDSEANVDPIGERYVNIHAYNTDFDLCKLVKSSLERLGYHPEIYKKRGFTDCYRVILQKIRDVIKYKRQIGFTIERKISNLKELISSFERKAEYYKQKYKEMRELKEKGLSYRKIEEVIGVEEHTLCRWDKDKRFSMDLDLPDFYELVKHLQIPHKLESKAS